MVPGAGGWSRRFHLHATLILLAAVLAGRALAVTQPTFHIEDDRFIKDGKPVQLISGSIHYFRIHPAYWRDRLERSRAMGLNAVEVYVAWNMHEPHPGQYVWEGFADLERFIAIAQELGLMVLLRPGPYICAEWDFGGFPWWLASSKVAGGGTMRLRQNDPAYLAHVDRWWGVLFSKMAPLLYQRGGPIVMVQIENEYGFCGSDKDYLRHLVKTARMALGDEILLFTTDPPGVAEKGTLAGDDIYTVVDFGPGWFDPAGAFAVQKKLNPPGKSPPLCSEFYTGWLSHWGERMANTSTEVLAQDTLALLQFANSTGSVNFYMVHGGSNFGFWAGANVDGSRFLPHITSYDYDAPISEGGDYCQPGIGGPCKYEALREVISKHLGAELPTPPPRPAVEAYGRVALQESLPLFETVGELFSGDGVYSEVPEPMEEYEQSAGLILYRTRLPEGALDGRSGQLELGAPVHDYASVYVGGELVGRLDRSDGTSSLKLPAQRKGSGSTGVLELAILVEAFGHQNFGCDTGSWDTKGLQSKDVSLNGTPLRGWRVFPLQLDDLSSLSYATGHAGSAVLGAARRLLARAAPAEGVLAPERMAPDPASGGPVFYRGTFKVDFSPSEGRAHLPDTYLSLHNWGKGVAWVNGFNLGWYWASQGPQMTLYVPGPVLRQGGNEVVLLEVESPPDHAQVVFQDAPDFFGPGGPSPEDCALGAVPPERRRRVP